MDRIVSLVPSITKSLFDFGLTKNEIIGRTKFCIHPSDSIKDIAEIGGTKNLKIDEIAKLNPNLIIANKEENTKDQIEELQTKFQVWITDVKNLNDNRKFISELGLLLNQNEKANDFNEKINKILESQKLKNTINTVYLIWRKPYMTVGGDTFINDVLKQLGICNQFQHLDRYPEITLDDIKNSEYIFLSSEPFPFKEKHIKELRENGYKRKAILVDGEAFSWFGTHLASCEDYFENLLKQLR